MFFFLTVWSSSAIGYTDFNKQKVPTDIVKILRNHNVKVKQEGSLLT
jgi:hypothetical protein